MGWDGIFANRKWRTVVCLGFDLKESESGTQTNSTTHSLSLSLPFPLFPVMGVEDVWVELSWAERRRRREEQEPLIIIIIIVINNRPLFSYLLEKLETKTRIYFHFHFLLSLYQIQSHFHFITIHSCWVESRQGLVWPAVVAGLGWHGMEWWVMGWEKIERRKKKGWFSLGWIAKRWN